jgi:hypothetical protein
MTDLETCPNNPLRNAHGPEGAQWIHRMHNWLRPAAFESPLAVVLVCRDCPAALVLAPLGLGPLIAIVEAEIRAGQARTAAVLEGLGLVPKSSNQGLSTGEASRHGIDNYNGALKNFP